MNKDKEADKEYNEWFDKLTELGLEEKLFNKHGAMPYKGKDGLFYSCYTSGMTPKQALGESLVEQDWA